MYLKVFQNTETALDVRYSFCNFKNTLYMYLKVFHNTETALGGDISLYNFKSTL